MTRSTGTRGEVLQEHAADDERHLGGACRGGLPARQRFDIIVADARSVDVADHAILQWSLPMAAPSPVNPGAKA